MLSIFIPMLAQSYNAKIGDVYYNLNSGDRTAEVTYGKSSISTYEGVIVIPAQITYGGITYTVTTIGYEAFFYCESLVSVTLPNTITKIGESAFYQCLTLTKLTVPNSVTSIGASAFKNCSTLNSVTIGDNVLTIGARAFENCYSLKSVTIPNSVISIGGYAFDACHDLVSITIGSGVTVIGTGAFDCTNSTNRLRDIYIYAEQVPTTGNNVFPFIYTVWNSATLHVPEASLDAYRTTSPWSNFTNIVAIPSTDTAIDGMPVDATAPTQYYDLNGRMTTTPRRGLNIIRTGDGILRKIMVK